MTVDAWLEAAVADAEGRGLPELKPLLEGLAQATRALREARFTGSAELGAPRPDAAPGNAGSSHDR